MSHSSTRRPATTVDEASENLAREPIYLRRRSFLQVAGASTLAMTGLIKAAEAQSTPHVNPDESTVSSMNDEILKEKIRRARLSGPSAVTSEAAVAEMNAQGEMVILHKGTNQWVCMPGNENIIGDVPMAMDPMGMQWYMDLRARRPKPTNTSPGLIYMLCGATQRSFTDPFDTTSPAIPIGPHWMVLWPFDAATSGLPTIMRDAGTLIMFAGTPYAHLHICGSPVDGQEYHPGDRGIWTMSYSRG